MFINRDYVNCSSGDGYLSIFNLKKQELEAQSDATDEDMLCAATIQNERFIVVGTETGVVTV
jgi:hypothetical protein